MQFVICNGAGLTVGQSATSASQRVMGAIFGCLENVELENTDLAIKDLHVGKKTYEKETPATFRFYVHRSIEISDPREMRCVGGGGGGRGG